MAGTRPSVEPRECWKESASTAPGHFAKAAHWAQAPRERHAFSLEKLTSVIEGEIIPRLLLAHRLAAPPAELSAAEGFPGSMEVDEFTRLVLTDDFPAALAYVEALGAKGTSLESLLLVLLAPSARRLGEFWESDVCDFTQVTIGLSRLQQVLRELSPAFENEVERRCRSSRALLVPAPGEQHTFGMFMVDEFLRRAGWDVFCGAAASCSDLAALVRNEWYAIVGFSLSCESRLEALATTIRTIRRESCNPAIGVMVGGRVFAEQPDLAALIGADATAGDARKVAREAESLLRIVTNGR